MQEKQSIYRKATLLAVPMMIQNGITNMVGLVDNVMVGKLGTEAMTGVSIGGQLMFVFNLAVFGGMSGPGIYGAQFFGKQDMEGVRNVFRLKHWIGGVILLLAMAVFLCFGEPLVGFYLRGESEDIDPVLTMQYALRYLRFMLPGLLPFTLTQIYASSLREVGDSFKPMVAGVISVGADILLNYLLIYGKFGLPALGVTGAAAATVTARCIECLVVMIWAMHRSREHIYRTMKIPLRLAGIILPKSLPIFCNEFLWAGGIAAMTQSYSVRGLDIVAGLNISNALCNLLNVVFVALGTAVGILTGQLLGAGQFEKARRDSFRLMLFTGGVSVLLTVILIAVSGIFPQFYVTSDTVRRYGTVFIILTACFFPVQGLMNALYFTLRSGGKTVVTFLFDSVFTWVIPVPMAFLLCQYTDVPIMEVYALIQAADLIKVIIGAVLIQKGIWISDLTGTQAEHG